MYRWAKFCAQFYVVQLLPIYIKQSIRFYVAYDKSADISLYHLNNLNVNDEILYLEKSDHNTLKVLYPNIKVDYIKAKNICW